MTYEEIKQRILLHGTPCGLFSWDEESRTLSAGGFLVFNFEGIDNINFSTGGGCNFKTGDNCTFSTGGGCNFTKFDRLEENN